MTTIRPHAVLALAALLLASSSARAQSNQSGGEQLNPTTSANSIANGGTTGAAMPINKIEVPATPASEPGPATEEKDKPPKALHVIKPPKKKKYSDRALARKIRGEIDHDLTFPQSYQNIKVAVAAGKVTLTGTVLTDDDKYKVAAKAAVLVGADNVVNLIDVKPAAPAQ